MWGRRQDDGLPLMPPEANAILRRLDQHAPFHYVPPAMQSTTTHPLIDRISAALETSPYVPDKKVKLEEQAGAVVLKGHVDSFFQKQMAQEVLRRVDGVESIQNQLVVNWA